jgi:hypothetical protein
VWKLRTWGLQCQAADEKGKWSGQRKNNSSGASHEDGCAGKCIKVKANTVPSRNVSFQRLMEKGWVGSGR